MTAASTGRSANVKIARAKQLAADKYGDRLPLEALDRARRMAERHGWVRRRIETHIPLREEEQMGEDVFVPSPGQEVGSGARPSKRDPKPLSFIYPNIVDRMGWKERLDVGAVSVRWPAIVGPAIAQNCVVEDFSDDGILTLRAKSTSWQTQVRALLAFLDKKLAEELGEGVVKDIVVNGPHVPSWKHGPYSVPGRGPRDTYG
ncbi:putative nucleic acid-binding Zn ribbon protein [Trueperella bonasi]|uniref:Nucleic acid-binding Zn ribbon protein n=1 Tax=Trueperella bonasi TaxID=312286 RepID=A0ABT9NGM9_9ACTO|nr:DciA family protein [Trueperella bonasi]MDP9806340.1 putative nucleic acid-binding Zn ribbon protein [Trueperella bonasi]